MATAQKPIVLLDGDEVVKYLPLNELIIGVEKSFIQFSSKTEGVSVPQRLFLPLGTDENFFLVKPAISLPDKTLSTKLLTLYPNNEREFGIPNLQSIVVVFDAENGSLQAVLDGKSITDLRTAAASAVAVKHLAPNGNKLAIIGTGYQAVSHIQLMRELKEFREILVYGRNKEKCDEFAKRWNVTACESVEQAVCDADIIITVTTSKTAVLFHKWVKKNALVCIVGAPEPHAREVDDDIMLKSQVITDSIEAGQNCGDIKLSGATVHGELGDVVIGKVKAEFDKLRVFKSNGMAIQDLVAGKIIVANYRLANN